MPKSLVMFQALNNKGEIQHDTVIPRKLSTKQIAHYYRSACGGTKA